MAKKINLDHARPIDVWIWSNKPEIRRAADYIFSQLVKKQRLERRMKPDRLKNHLKVILTDLYVAHKEDPRLYLAISRDMSRYVPGKRFRKIFLNPKYTALITDFLTQEGYIEFHKGVNFVRFSRMSRMKATQKLLRYFQRHRSSEGLLLNRRPEIILRDENKNEVPVNFDGLLEKTLLKNVRKINACLNRHNVSLDFEGISKLDWASLGTYFTPRCTKYVRIFNNSSFEQGGRFYCHWSQMIPKELRKNILIDGQPTVELDYSCLHISMLYGLEGQRPPEGDLYSVTGISSGHRNLVKRAVNIAINGSSEREVLQAIREAAKEEEARTGNIPPLPKDILSSIKITHPILQKYLCTGYGVFLQNMDSNIAESILLSLSEQNICSLCVHDSFIISSEYTEMLSELMCKAFYSKFNFYPTIKI